MRETIAIHWFRNDLRLSDNPALCAAATHTHVIPLYIVDEAIPSEYRRGGASCWWLDRSLSTLRESLHGALSIYRGDPWLILEDIIRRRGVEAVYWNHSYEPWHVQRDPSLRDTIAALGVTVRTFNGSLLWEPDAIRNKAGGSYRVFTPFYRKGCLKAEPPRRPLARPNFDSYVSDEAGLDTEPLSLMPKEAWHDSLARHWQIGEQAAQQKLRHFLQYGLREYAMNRDVPAASCVSRLSPHLRFGEISPHQVWHAVRDLGEDTEYRGADIDNRNVDSQSVDPTKEMEATTSPNMEPTETLARSMDVFCSELGWREFAASQTYHHPDLPHATLQTSFDSFPWEHDATLLASWQRGKTGIPMVDAGMRELWNTGYMHNRVRMIAASFLVKNLLQDWRLGARWFWDTLVDADLANNSVNWQWVAGCGIDPAPYFRIFNPVMQGKRFDPNGDYIRAHVPELSRLPTAHIFSPWEASERTLTEAGVVLGTTYPLPVVDIQKSRERALDAYRQMRSKV